MIPAELASSFGLIEPSLQKLMTFMQRRIEADLSGMHVVSVTSRSKRAESALQKLHKGAYESLDALTDLVGLTVVVLYRREVQEALDILRTSGLSVVSEPNQRIQPTDFRYREPKIFLAPPVDYVERNPELSGLVAEVQFTTAIQHALDMTTHDFDYKGHSYSWSNFRLVAQLRGMLELVDQIIDDIEKVTIPNHEIIEAPESLLNSATILGVVEETFASEFLPNDRRRLADTVASWTSAANLDADGLRELLSRHRDLIDATSLDPTSAILGAILREHIDDLLSNYDGHLLISGELLTLCGQAEFVPIERRVRY